MVSASGSVPGVATAIILLLSTPTSFVDAGDRSASQILREFDSIRMPGLQPSDMSDEEYSRVLTEGCQKQIDLAWEFYQSHPRHRRTPELLQGEQSL